MVRLGGRSPSIAHPRASRWRRALAAAALGVVIAAGVPQAALHAGPASADGSAGPGAGSGAGIVAGPHGRVFAPVPPDADPFGPARRAELARAALHFPADDSEGPDEAGLVVLPVPLPWPPGAGDRARTVSAPAGAPLFLLAALAPSKTDLLKAPAVTVDDLPVLSPLKYVVGGVPVSDGARMREHVAVAMVVPPLPVGRHVITTSCGGCAPVAGPWLSHVNGSHRTYVVDVAEAAVPETAAAAPAATAPGHAGVPARVPDSLAVERRFHSTALGREMPYRIYLPRGHGEPDNPLPGAVAGANSGHGAPAADSTAGRRYPVLYLLHGVGAGYRQWSRLGIEAELDRAGAQVIVVMPSGRAGYWTNHADGGLRWGDYLTEDLVRHVDTTYRTIPTREARAIGGLSMGAYGALQLGLKRPDLFSAVGAHSPALRPRHDAPAFLGGTQMVAAVGQAPPLQEYAARDPLTLASHSAISAPPAFWLDTGDRDPWATRARELRDVVRARRWTHEWQAAPGGHDADYWTRRLPDYVRWYLNRLTGTSQSRTAL